MKITYSLHGFNVRDRGARTIGRLTKYLAPFSLVLNNSYRWFGLFQVLWFNGLVAKMLKTRIMKEIRPTDTCYAVGHSNGCAIILRALKMGVEFEAILLINPALNIRTKFPPNVKRIIVVHTEHDKVVKYARFLNSIPIVEWMIPDAWGAMGQKGYEGNDPRVLNLDFTHILDAHSALFKELNLQLKGTYLAKALYHEIY